MTNNKFAKAYKEVIEIIKHFPEEDYNKIPKEKIEFYEKNMDKDYEFSIDPTVDLSKQNISKEANAIIIMLFQEYFATDKQKDLVDDILKLNEKKSEHEKIKRYNPDNLFKKKQS